MIGTVYAIVGPSGAGKDTLMMQAAALRPDLVVMRRVITRASDAGGEDFDGITDAAFASRQMAGDFALQWQAHGLSYGVPASIHTYVQAGRDVIFNGSRAALSLANSVFDPLVVVLVTAPSSVLAARLALRGRESAADIAARLQRAPFELPLGITARVVCNDGTLRQGVDRFMDALQPVKA